MDVFRIYFDLMYLIPMNEKSEKRSKIIAFAEDRFQTLSQKFDKDGFAIPLSKNVRPK